MNTVFTILAELDLIGLYKDHRVHELRHRIEGTIFIVNWENCALNNH